MSERPTILLVEDEESITVPLAAALDREEYEVEIAGTVADALAAAERVRPDLILLDLMLPDGSGFDVCREVRAASNVPIIMLTARAEMTERVVGLELGADDYVVKPFAAREVIARIRAVMRRVEMPKPTPSESIAIGDVELDAARRTLALAGATVDLSRKEFDLLHALMRDAGTVVSRERLMAEVWDTEWMGSTKTLDVHVSAIRKKLGDEPNEPRYLHTVRGVGFRFATPEEHKDSRPPETSAA